MRQAAREPVDRVARVPLRLRLGSGSEGVTNGSGNDSGSDVTVGAGSISASGSSGRSAYHADATASPVQSRSKSPNTSLRFWRKSENISPENSPVCVPKSCSASWTAKAKPRYLPSRTPSSAETIATACRSGERRPRAARSTAKPARKPIPHATIPTS